MIIVLMIAIINVSSMHQAARLFKEKSRKDE